MKIKEVHAGIKLTENYNSYQASLTAEVESGEDPKKVGKNLIEEALAIVSEKMDFGKKFKSRKEEFSGVEVGAAWPHKKSSNFFSVKMSEEDSWEDVRIKNLEKIEDGYRRKTNEGIFIFKKIPDEKRTSSKMPMFRIYALTGHENRLTGKMEKKNE